jgi:hypothetical protein
MISLFPYDPADELQESITLHFDHTVTPDYAESVATGLRNEFGVRGVADTYLRTQTICAGSILNGWYVEYRCDFGLWAANSYLRKTRTFTFTGHGLIDTKDILIIVGLRESAVRDLALELAMELMDAWRTQTDEASSHAEAFEKVKLILSPGYTGL